MWDPATRMATIGDKEGKTVITCAKYKWEEVQEKSEEVYGSKSTYNLLILTVRVINTLSKYRLAYHWSIKRKSRRFSVILTTQNRSMACASQPFIFSSSVYRFTPPVSRPGVYQSIKP